MERRKWQADEKLAIVLEGLKSEANVQEICRRHNINQNQYYKWRDQFLQGAKEYIQYGGNGKEVYELKHRIHEFERIIGKQAIQIEILKKTEELIGR